MKAGLTAAARGGNDEMCSCIMGGSDGDVPRSTCIDGRVGDVPRSCVTGASDPF